MPIPGIMPIANGPRAMPLAAIIAAFETTSAGDDTLAATRPFAGATVLEHQARRARRAGARRLILLAEEPHPALIAIAHRLRRDGLPTDIATGLVDAANRLDSAEAVLVIADGCLAGQAELRQIAASAPPTLLTVTDRPGRDLYERIDASARWAGVALFDGALLRETGAMLGEWDPLSVLLRRAVQTGAARLPVNEDREEGLPVFAHAQQGLAGIERRLVAGTRGLGTDWPSARIYPLMEEQALPPLFRRQIDPWWLIAGGVGLALVGAAVAHVVPLLALACLLLSGPLATLADRLALIRAGEIARRRLFEAARTAAAAVALLSLTHRLAGDGQWGWWALALALPGAMAALHIERRTWRALDDGGQALWLASLDGLIWALVPFGLIGQWGIGLGALALYALGSAGWVQHQVAQAVSPIPRAT